MTRHSHIESAWTDERGVTHYRCLGCGRRRKSPNTELRVLLLCLAATVAAHLAWLWW